MRHDRTHDDGTAIAVVERGECLYQVKIDNVTAGGYDAIFIFTSETGDPPCEALIGTIADTEIRAYFVSRSVGYAILGIEGYDPANCPGGANPALPTAGAAGATVTLSSQFDGWGARTQSVFSQFSGFFRLGWTLGGSPGIFG